MNKNVAGSNSKNAALAKKLVRKFVCPYF